MPLLVFVEVEVEVVAKIVMEVMATVQKPDLTVVHGLTVPQVMMEGPVRPPGWRGL